MSRPFTQLVVPAIAVAAVTACGAGRSTFARHPAAATTFDRAGADPKALAVADRVIAAAGGAERWNQVKQLRWTEQVATGGKVVIAFDEAWDRWNGRIYERIHNAADKSYTVGTSYNPTQSVRSGEGDIVVMGRLYEDSGGGAFFDTGHGLEAIRAEEAGRAKQTARERWQLDTISLCMSFLLEEPGTRLAYAGEVAGEAGQPPLDDLKVSFDPKDPTRTATYHVLVDRGTHRIERIEIVEAGQADTRRIAYRLRQWTEVSGLQFATRDENLAVDGDVITFSAITTGDPDDTLYVPQVQ